MTQTSSSASSSALLLQRRRRRIREEEGEKMGIDGRGQSRQQHRASPSLAPSYISIFLLSCCYILFQQSRLASTFPVTRQRRISPTSSYRAYSIGSHNHNRRIPSGEGGVAVVRQSALQPSLRRSSSSSFSFVSNINPSIMSAMHGGGGDLSSSSTSSNSNNEGRMMGINRGLGVGGNIGNGFRNESSNARETALYAAPATLIERPTAGTTISPTASIEESAGGGGTTPEDDSGDGDAALLLSEDGLDSSSLDGSAGKVMLGSQSAAAAAALSTIPPEVEDVPPPAPVKRKGRSRKATYAEMDFTVKTVDDVCRATINVISTGDEADLAMLTPFVERLLTRYGDHVEILHRSYVPDDKPGLRLLEIWFEGFETFRLYSRYQFTKRGKAGELTAEVIDEMCTKIDYAMYLDATGDFGPL